MKSERAVSPTDISDLLGQPLSNVAFHVRVLYEESGLLVLADSEPIRGSVKHFYVFADEVVREYPWARETLAEIEVPLPIPTWPQPPIDEDTFNRYRDLLTPVEQILLEYRRGWNGRKRTSREALATAMDIKLEKVRLVERSACTKIERARYDDQHGGS